MTAPQSDGVLVRRVLEGDVDSFTLLVRRYQDRYARYAMRMLGNREDAEEALQDAFVRAYRSLGQCENPERFGPWFHTILVNQCRTLGRRRGGREKRLAREEEFDELPAATTDGEAGDWRGEIELALSKLNLEQREAFLLKHVEDLSYEEMSAATGEHISTLKMRVKRACDKMREQLQGVLQ